ncbi:dCTP deaminase [Pelomyxa schiedti]|nr:dCTP deaminase [Pelomyxa schiedti]
MAVLCRDEILRALEAGDIAISPFDPANVGPASIDLTLGTEFRYFNRAPTVIKVREETNYKDFSEKVTIPEDGVFLLLPGQSCLAITKESIKLSPSICGLLEGRSRFARLGLFVHITASFINPGIANRQVLEIYNSSSLAMELYPGTKICQFVFLLMKGAATYSGIFRENSL